MSASAETVTVRKSPKGYWWKRFDDYPKSERRISKEEAFTSRNRALAKGLMIVSFSDYYAYYN
ncbi:MAG: hypothetical protein AAF717_00140 [Bacteroidota bacterium]